MTRSTAALRMALVAGILVMGAPEVAHGLQPLETFVSGARQHNPDAREGEANIQAQEAQAEYSLAHITPSVALRGTYQRNQYAVALPLSLLEPGAPPGAVLTLTPSDQFDGTFTLSVPLVDVAGIWRAWNAKLDTESARDRLEATRLQLEAQVVQAYYQVVADQALILASQRALDVAQATAKVTRDRVESGRSPALEQHRADALVEQQIQQQAQSDLLMATALQALESLSGVTPEPQGAALASDDLHEEASWDSLLAGPPTPALAAAQVAHQSAQKTLDGAWFTLLPALSGSFNAHDGNYPGFSGHEGSLTGGLSLQWMLDLSAHAALKAAQAQVAIAAARQARVQQALRDSVHNAWSAVHAALVRSRSTRSQEQLTRKTAELMQIRYEVGSSTQLDLLQAQRDAFSAEVARIQADADLVNARAQLQLAAGHDPLTPPGATP